MSGNVEDKVRRSIAGMLVLDEGEALGVVVDRARAAADSVRAAVEGRPGADGVVAQFSRELVAARAALERVEPLGARHDHERLAVKLAEGEVGEGRRLLDVADMLGFGRGRSEELYALWRVLGQPAWTRKPVKDGPRYVAGAARRQTARQVADSERVDRERSSVELLRPSVPDEDKPGRSMDSFPDAAPTPEEELLRARITLETLKLLNKAIAGTQARGKVRRVLEELRRRIEGGEPIDFEDVVAAVAAVPAERKEIARQVRDRMKLVAGGATPS
ncbi:MAG TPA: hypothetical protein VLT84_11825 [Acidobacteriota bacterium]|nr:hypothetical protein [Acidobacteriota bacterium]